MDSQAGRRQLVGSTCVLCEKRVGSILEGGWCERCGQASHFACRKPGGVSVAEGQCAACGGQLPTAITRGERGRERTEERPRWWDYDLTWVAEIYLQITAIPLLILALVIWFLMHQDPDVRVYVATSFALVALLAEIIAFGLYKRQSWARAAAIGLLTFLLLMEAIALVAWAVLFAATGVFNFSLSAIVYLLIDVPTLAILLFHPGTAAAFQGRGKGQPLQERAGAEDTAPAAPQ